MHDKLKLLLDKVNLPDNYYDAFNQGKILKLKMDTSRTKGIFVIEVENMLDDNIIKYINDNIGSAFPDLEYIKADFIVRNIDYTKMDLYYKDSIENSTLTKPMKELFKDKKVTIDNKELIIEVDNIAEQNIVNMHKESILNYFINKGFKEIKINTDINEDNSK